MILDCILCNIPGKDYGTLPVYNVYSSTPSGEFSGVKRYFSFLKCPECGLWWVKDADEDYEKIYKTEEYWFEHQKEVMDKPTLDKRFHIDSKFSKLRIPEIQKYIKSGKAVDIGCSSGTLVKELKDLGFDACGMEMNSKVCEIAKAYSGCKIVEDLKELPDNSFDLVVATDVLEHLREPLKDFKLWVNKLKMGGLMLLEFPDSDCEGGQKGIYWYDYVFPEEHLYYWNTKTIHKLLKKFNMIPIETCNVWTTDRLRVFTRKMF